MYRGFSAALPNEPSYLLQKELDLAFAAAGSARAANGGSHADEDDDDEDEDEYEDDEGLFGAEQLFDTPLDKLDSYVLFGQVVQGELIRSSGFI